MQQEKLLKLLFNEGETICVSPSQLGYRSIPIDMCYSNDVKLEPPPDAWNTDIRWCDSKDIQLVAINPINGFRRDENVTAFRSFLVELDDGSLQEQFSYIREIELPYSCCVFSGSKSLHFAITLDEDLPDEETYRLFAEWILKIVSRADQKTKNPSRSIRFAGNVRKETGKEMKLLDIRGRIGLSDLMFWLSRHPDKDPRLEIMKRSFNPSPTLEGVPVWVWNKLKVGIDESKGRNNEWFCIFSEFSKAGYGYEDMISALEEYFTPDRDFKLSEWKTIAKSAYKRAGKFYG
jgi:hypothetical protein